MVVHNNYSKETIQQRNVGSLERMRRKSKSHTQEGQSKHCEPFKKIRDEYRNAKRISKEGNCGFFCNEIQSKVEAATLDKILSRYRKL